MKIDNSFVTNYKKILKEDQRIIKQASSFRKKKIGDFYFGSTISNLNGKILHILLYPKAKKVVCLKLQKPATLTITTLEVPPTKANFKVVDRNGPTLYELLVTPKIGVKKVIQLGFLTKSNKISTLEAVIKKANEEYYASGNQAASSISDAEYDYWKDILTEIDPKNKLINQVGHAEQFGTKVELPTPLGSLNKVKPGKKELDSWLTKVVNQGESTLVASEKLDGVSAGLEYDTTLQRAYTRGDGYTGRLITNNIKHVKDVPTKIKGKYSIRGEIIMAQKVFHKYYSEFKNPRNLISGAINRKDIDITILKKSNFVAYEIIGSKLSKLDQFKLLVKLGFSVPNYKTISIQKANSDKFTKILDNFQANSTYAADGIVLNVNDPAIIKKMGNETNSIKPRHARAFKVDDDKGTIATVERVEWNISKGGLLKPRVQLDPIDLSGVTISYATGFNAKFIKEKGIGPNAEISIIRSGDVIPHIVDVIKPVKAQLPTKCPSCKSTLAMKGVDLVCANAECQGKLAKSSLFFIRKIGIENLSKQSVQKLMDAGYTSLDDLLKMTRKQAVELLKTAKGNELYEGLRSALTDIPLANLMHATGFFGNILGTRRLQVLVSHFGVAKLLNYTKYNAKLYDEILRVPGFSQQTALMFATNLPDFVQWYKQWEKRITLAKEVKKQGTKLDGKTIVFTGFRNKSLEKWIEANGGKISSTVSKNTNILLVKSVSSESAKADKARSLGVTIMTEKDFVVKYQG